MVLFKLKVLAKFDLCSNCSQNLDKCLLAHSCKIVAATHMLGFWSLVAFSFFSWCISNIWLHVVAIKQGLHVVGFELLCPSLAPILFWMKVSKRLQYLAYFNKIEILAMGKLQSAHWLLSVFSSMLDAPKTYMITASDEKKLILCLDACKCL